MDGTERRRFDVQNSQPTNTIRASFSKHCPVFWLCPLFSWAHHTLVRHQSMGYISDLLHNFIYLALYTPLKKTSWAIEIGAVSGALPPLVGWVAAANESTAYGWILFGILFAWQLPHFMAIAWNHRSDYSKGGFQLHKMGDDEGRSLSFKSLIYTIILTVLVFLLILWKSINPPLDYSTWFLPCYSPFICFFLPCVSLFHPTETCTLKSSF